MARKSQNDLDPTVVLFLLLAVVVIISLGAALLYLPLKKYSNRTPGKIVAVMGIVIVLAGSLTTGYHFLLVNENDMSRRPEVPWIGWWLLAGGLALYVTGLATASSYRARVSGAKREIAELIANENLSEPQLVETAQKICQNRALPPSEMQEAISYGSQARALKVIENDHVLPMASPPIGVFLKLGEQCHASFATVLLYEDVVGTQRSTAGGAVYVRLGKGITLRPAAYSGKSMPVAELKQVDAGTLVITNSRVIFQGQRYRFDIPMRSIEGLSPYSDGFQIQTVGKSKRQVFSMSPVEVRLASTVICKLVIGG